MVQFNRKPGISSCWSQEDGRSMQHESDAARLTAQLALFGFVGEGELGFLVDDERACKTVGDTSARNLHRDRKDTGDALLKIENVGGSRGRRW